MSSHHGQVVGAGHQAKAECAGSYHQYKHAYPCPDKYLKQVLNLLISTWHPNQHCFKVFEAQKLTGKLAHLTEGANWVFCLLSHVYLSTAYALSENKDSCWSHLMSFLQLPKPCKLALS